MLLPLMHIMCLHCCSDLASEARGTATHADNLHRAGVPVIVMKIIR